jgi:predicted ester cyclase
MGGRATMPAEENIALIRGVVDAHNRHDWQAAASAFATDATNHGRPAGRAGMERIYQEVYATFPDFHFELELLLSDGAWVTAYYSMSGTHLGTPHLPVFGGLLHGVTPTCRQVVVPNIHLYRIESGLIVEHRAVRDDLGMMQQLGLLPTTRHESGDISRPESHA